MESILNEGRAFDKVLLACCVMMTNLGPQTSPAHIQKAYVRLV